ncbi:MAG: Crp/Fnr family transcriptional regulator [Solirubrobacterales bacterium]
MGINPAFDLGRVALFKGLNGCDLTGLLAAAQRIALSRDSAFFHEEDAATRCYLLVRGQVKLVQHAPEGGQVILRFIAPGEMFGWATLMGGSVYPASAETLVDSVALAWDNAAMERAVRAHPTMALNALAIMGGRLREAEERLRELATERVERRLARALLRLGEQSGRATANGVEIPFPLSRQLLAETTGATLHTVSRILAAWEQQGIITGGRQRLALSAPDRIRTLAESG